jgi:hypothetical protein
LEAQVLIALAALKEVAGDRKGALETGKLAPWAS